MTLSEKPVEMGILKFECNLNSPLKMWIQRKKDMFITASSEIKKKENNKRKWYKDYEKSRKKDIPWQNCGDAMSHLRRPFL